MEAKVFKVQVAHGSYPSGYYGLVEFNGRGNGQTEVEVLPADTVYGGGGPFEPGAALFEVGQ